MAEADARLTPEAAGQPEDMARHLSLRPDTPREPVPSRPAATITPYRDGPLVVRGDFQLLDQDGNEIDAGRETVALCRCGKSGIKPFCDSSHKRAGFHAGSAPNRPRPAALLRPQPADDPPAG
jgi:CDGSH-type Zn-finger protein